MAKAAAALVLLAVALAGCDWRGPDPTEASVTATTGPFAYDSTSVGPGHGFGGGTIWFPTDSSVGLFGGVAVAPGFLEGEDVIAWYGPRLASQGFVVITISTTSGFDQPASRATQLLAALDHLTQESAVKDRVDPGRLAVMGHSMGGGGALLAARARPSLRAAVPLAPWSSSTDFGDIAVPTLIVGCEDDAIAPVASHAEPFYTSIPGTTRKAYLEIESGDHFCVTRVDTTVAKHAISFLKRFVDTDTRYNPFLCPGPAAGDTVSEYRSTCPY